MDCARRRLFYILVVEDQPDGHQIIRDMLAGTGNEITEAENGEETFHDHNNRSLHSLVSLRLAAIASGSLQ
jgi:CheY-like chemotaxis protein